MTENTHNHQHGATAVAPQPSAHNHHQHHAQMDHNDHDTHQGHEMQPDQSKHAGHGGHGSHAGHEIMFRNRFWVSLVLSIPVLYFSPMLQHWLGYAAPTFPGSAWIAPVLSVVIFFYGGLPFLQMATWELREKQPGMMTLISLAITVAFVYSVATLFADLGESFFWELVTLIDVMLLGHWLEMRSVRQASGALDELAKLMPDEAERIGGDGRVEKIAAAQLQKGDRVLVRPGGSIPADGEVSDGSSDVNEAMITGESKPVKKEPGSLVIGGTVNEGSGSLRIVVTATGDETALSGIMRLVQEAQASKSKTQLLADRAAAFLFYAALAAAVLTAVLWTIATGFNVEVLSRVVTVLVIACPHALGLAVPLVVAITTALSARNGILVRDRRALEAAREIDTIIFDKTGTLTKGEQGVVGIVTIVGVSEEEALALAAGLEADSEHAIARAIVTAAQARGVTPASVSDFAALKGRGVQAMVAGTASTEPGEVAVTIGGPRLLEYLEVELPETIAAFSQEAGKKGQAVIYLVRGQKVIAAFALADVIREESRQAIQKLHEMGIEVAMLTGDSQDVARAVAAELNIDRYFAEVLPEDKDKKVSELQKQGKKVAMVGDGVNDAPALTRADIGIAIGSGTDVAVESAGLILVQSNPLDVVKIIELSRASQRKMVQNIWWAAGYNIVAIPLAMGILAPWGIFMPPAVGALVMSVSTIIVALNAQTLRRVVLTAN
ncbi:MAG TPA: heavy metal translocating P-type ATPase [Chloroflexota bacterium]|nr:heavy metal translocating P-type ATPase [Chloroflexota bacterium]